MSNMIVLYNEKTILFRIKYDIDSDGEIGWYVSMHGDYDGIVAIPCGEDTLPIFILGVLIHSSFERISSMNIADITNPIIDNVLHNGSNYKQVRYK